MVPGDLVTGPLNELQDRDEFSYKGLPHELLLPASNTSVLVPSVL